MKADRSCNPVEKRWVMVKRMVAKGSREFLETEDPKELAESFKNIIWVVTLMRGV